MSVINGKLDVERAGRRKNSIFNPRAIFVEWQGVSV